MSFFIAIQITIYYQARIYHTNHPAHAPLFAVICKTKKINVRPRFSLMIYTVAPPGSIISGSAPDYSPTSISYNTFNEENDYNCIPKTEWDHIFFLFFYYDPFWNIADKWKCWRFWRYKYTLCFNREASHLIDSMRNYTRFRSWKRMLFSNPP